ncbi:11342_t:CDS:2, partial [Acaulospora colombiana]
STSVWALQVVNISMQQAAPACCSPVTLPDCLYSQRQFFRHVPSKHDPNPWKCQSSKDLASGLRARVYSPDQAFLWNIEEGDPKTNLAHLLHLLSELEILDIKAGPRYDRDILPYLINFLNKSHPLSKLQRFEWR